MVRSQSAPAQLPLPKDSSPHLPTLPLLREQSTPAHTGPP
jgi:hypothetical protein